MESREFKTQDRTSVLNVASMSPNLTVTSPTAGVDYATSTTASPIAKINLAGMTGCHFNNLD